MVTKTEARPYSFETRLAECGARRGDAGLKAVMQNVDVVAVTCIGIPIIGQNVIRTTLIVNRCMRSSNEIVYGPESR